MPDCPGLKRSFPLRSKSQISLLKIGNESMYHLGLLGRLNETMHEIHGKSKQSITFFF